MVVNKGKTWLSRFALVLKISYERQQAAPIIPLQLNIDPEDAAIIAVLDRVDNELAMRQQAAPNETI